MVELQRGNEGVQREKDQSEVLVKEEGRKKTKKI